jgi:hypothetical protein
VLPADPASQPKMSPTHEQTEGEAARTDLQAHGVQRCRQQKGAMKQKMQNRRTNEASKNKQKQPKAELQSERGM